MKVSTSAALAYADVPSTLPLRRTSLRGAFAALLILVALAGSRADAASLSTADSGAATLPSGDAIRHDVSPALWQLASTSSSSLPMDADQLKRLLATTDVWSGFGGPCEETTMGARTVTFDPRAERWVTEKIAGDLRCVAVSTTSDATGSYERSAFPAAVLGCDATCQSGFVAEHNRVRTRVNDHLMPAPSGFQPIPTPPLSPLSWDATIAAGAQGWSDLCVFQHSSGTGLGENLFASAGSVPTPATAVGSWESESSSYTYAAIGDPVNNFGAVGHYTQLVWASTSLVGCGVTHCTTNTPFPGFPEWDFIVCRYSPAGNFTGQFPYVAGVTCSNNAGCNDNNACTDDVCNNPGTVNSSCSHTGNTAACDDGNPCTGPDVCAAPASCGATQNFDGVVAPALPSGWTSTVTGTGNAWTTVNASSDTAPNSAFGFDGATVADEVLDSPAIAISSASATLTFRNRWSFENSTTCYDAAVLEIKIGAGAFTDIVTAGGSFTSGGYTGTVQSGFSNPLAGRSAWCTASAGYPAYVTTSVNLPAAAAGQTIQLRWRVGSDDSNGASGQNIDSIVINDVCPTACTGGPAITAPGETQNVLASADRATYSWSVLASATRYDVVRGSMSAFPVGPGGGDEACFDNLAGPTLVDATAPAPGAGFWYLSRGENSCGNGTYGTQGVHGAPGAARSSTTCP